MRRRLNPFMFTGLLPLLCNTQGIPGDGGGGGGAPPPAAGAPPAGQPAPPAGGAPAPPAAAPSGNGQFEPGWLNDRIAQAKKSAEAELLQRLGVTDPDAAKKAIAKAKELEDASKTELQRKDDQLKAANEQAAKADTYQKALQTRADADLAKLPQAAQDRIKALLGDKPDPIKVLEAIDLANAMAPAAGTPVAGQQGQQQPGQGAPGQGQQKPPVPPAASTTGAAGGPPSAPTSPVDHLAVWEDMQSKNPMAAAGYLLANEKAIVEAKQKKQT